MPRRRRPHRIAARDRHAQHHARQPRPHRVPRSVCLWRERRPRRAGSPGRGPRRRHPDARRDPLAPRSRVARAVQLGRRPCRSRCGRSPRVLRAALHPAGRLLDRSVLAVCPRAVVHLPRRRPVGQLLRSRTRDHRHPAAREPHPARRRRRVHLCRRHRVHRPARWHRPRRKRHPRVRARRRLDPGARPAVPPQRSHGRVHVLHALRFGRGLVRLPRPRQPRRRLGHSHRDPHRDPHRGGPHSVQRHRRPRRGLQRYLCPHRVLAQRAHARAHFLDREPARMELGHGSAPRARLAHSRPRHRALHLRPRRAVLRQRDLGLHRL
eukprot:Amastigsp_a843696_57.p3 type:complete len:323 gc:universal Amastigsp_a843696_57:997-29(-)